ncbi:MAG: patatin-like phospholipase family protein [Anaerolineales bacterium]|uniref:Patatin-like phospholipase family protein n=1 Tax=Candidatus Desulfolinea nitratireducens TaxID=2841698 RepID=A0A8J6NQE6_9CHLR|nr:patatin-like phospholipase family protein [Candidatus Desulfolinea nitratireducens]
MKEIAVALGGGGAKGNAHIGVLRRLEQEGYHIAAVAGTSFGGLVGAIYAAGYSPDEIETLFAAVDQSKLYHLGLHSQPSLFGIGKVHRWLDEVLGEKTFEDARIPCALTAADLHRNAEVSIQTGTLKNAILATIAIPGIFPPIELDGHYLVDGGVLNPVPVSLARELAPGLPVVAVALSSSLSPATLYHLPESFSSAIPELITRRLSRMNIAQAMNIFLQSVDMSYRSITELRLKSEPPDILIRPAVGEIGMLDQVVVADIVRLGEEATEIILPELARITRRPWDFVQELFGRNRS